VSRQLAFDLPGPEKLGREDFFVSPANAQGIAMIDLWRLWPRGMLLLVGPEGAGKTHLAQIWATEAGARVLTAEGLASADLNLLASCAMAVEDADRIAGKPAEETAMFHLHNLMRERKLPLLLTARQPPRDWGIALPDLDSRMKAMALVRIDPPDDALLSAVLAKLFADRQVTAPPALIPYLTSRMERSIDAARQLVAELDRRALARGGPISRSDAASLLADAAAIGPLDTAASQ
jgi:chromosomal replication initiation ATPase DnaA